jgi:glycosyltransferase involved in cell wall biosynthesis
MNILIISRCPPYPLHLGDRLILYHLVRHLAPRGHQLDLLAYYNDVADPKLVAKYAHWFRAVELIREPYRPSLNYLSRLLVPYTMFPRKGNDAWSATMWSAIRTALLQRKYDAVLLFGGIHVYEFRNLLRDVPTVIVPYESYSLYLTRKLAQQTTRVTQAYVRLQLWMAKQYERRMFTGFSRLVVISEVDAAMIRRLNPRYPLTVIEQGIDSDYFKPTHYSSNDPANFFDNFLPYGAAPGEQQVIFFGNFDYEPNLDAAMFLIDSIFPRIRNKLPDVKLLIVGNGAPTHVHKTNVEIIGRVPDLRPYIEQSQVFICPLRVGAGIKNKVLESMALAKAIVATPLSLEGLVLVPGEHALIGNTAQELATAAIELLQDEPRRTAMGAANRSLIEAHYSWQRTAETYEALLKELSTHA